MNLRVKFPDNFLRYQSRDGDGEWIEEQSVTAGTSLEVQLTGAGDVPYVRAYLVVGEDRQLRLGLAPADDDERSATSAVRSREETRRARLRRHPCGDQRLRVGATPPPGAIEHLAATVREAGERIGNGLSALASAVREHGACGCPAARHPLPTGDGPAPGD